ncbi:MAG: hypothetical protein M2R45_01778 [Verrucomicrobia subdivision 3 bacterium]|nr:hypothetical protein [Limisphaerales bacterium]MCS1415867.1 hypothetical protein [Limisphaerales bacterium]
MKNFRDCFLLTAFLLVFIESRGENPRGTGREAALEQLKELEVAEGLEVTLFASEPVVVNPANMDIDARGRVWVTEGANYRLWQKWGNLRPGGDRIMILEDTDLDGAADKETVYYQGEDVNTALGICVLDNRVIVSCSPQVLMFTDINGDDKPDEKDILFSGIKGVDHDHGVHAFVFGPDGRLYFNFGNDGKQIADKNGKPLTDPQGNIIADNRKPYQQGMVFRCYPDLSGFEVLGHNFRNSYEVCVDSFGTLWQSDNDDDGNHGVRINYVMEYGNYGYRDEITGAGWREERTGWEETIPERHWHLNDPGVVPNLLQTGAGSPTGILLYEGRLLPKKYRNQIIHCDAGPRVVRAYPVKRLGAGYSATIANILTSEDTWYRPSDVCVAPDGALFISDWNDAGVGGHNMADRTLEGMSGRIYRVAPKGNKPEVPNYRVRRTQGAIRALKSPNLAARYLGWTALREMQGEAEEALLSMWKGRNQKFRARALHLLAQIKGKADHYVQQAIQDKNPNIRITGLRIARERKLELVNLVAKLVHDPSPQVRRECAIALRHEPSNLAPDLWAELAQQHKGNDRWYLEALGIGAHGQEDRYFSAWLDKVGEEWNTKGGRDVIWRSRSKKTPALLVKIIGDKSLTEAEKLRYFRAMDFLEGPEKEAALVKLLMDDLGDLE